MPVAGRTVTGMVVECVEEPSVPVIVAVYEPGTAPAVALTVRVADDPVATVGEPSATATPCPAGAIEAVTAMVPLPDALVGTEVCPVEPGSTGSAVGVAGPNAKSVAAAGADRSGTTETASRAIPIAPLGSPEANVSFVDVPGAVKTRLPSDQGIGFSPCVNAWVNGVPTAAPFTSTTISGVPDVLSLFAEYAKVSRYCWPATVVKVCEMEPGARPSRSTDCEPSAAFQ